MMRFWGIVLLMLLLVACVEPTPELATGLPFVAATDVLPTDTAAPTLTPRRVTATLVSTATDVPATRTQRPTSTAAPPTNTAAPTRTLAPAWTATAAPPPTLPPQPTAVPPTIAPVVDTQPPPAPVGNCDAAYPDVCIPPPPPDLDCGDIPHRRFRVLAPDPHNFDGNDKDGIGCESG